MASAAVDRTLLALAMHRSQWLALFCAACCVAACNGSATPHNQQDAAPDADTGTQSPPDSGGAVTHGHEDAGVAADVDAAVTSARTDGGTDGGQVIDCLDNGTACDDHDACTHADACTAGRCRGVAKDCDDGVACDGVENCNPRSGKCTAGSSTCGSAVCDAAHDACTSNCDSGCLIDHVCWPDHALKIDDDCRQCDVSRSRTAWSLNDGGACGLDGDPCLAAGTCSALGACTRTPIAEHTECATPTACTSWACDGAGGCVKSSQAAGTACSTAENLCDIPDTCNGSDACLAQGVLALGASCVAHGTCTGQAAAPSCTCDVGFAASGEACVDIDECAQHSSGCDTAPDACVDEQGSFHCACPADFSGDGVGPHGCTCAHADYSPVCKPWSEVSLQITHACAISDGALFCWGGNEYGQLGGGDLVDRDAPARVGSQRNWQRVSVGNQRTCAIAAGKMYCWGNPAAGWLGTTSDGLVPAQVGTDSDWFAVAAGLATSCGIRGAGELYCWGWNDHGTLGLGNTTWATSPQRVMPGSSDFTAVDMDGLTACALRAGELYCWGEDTFGQVGDGGSADRLAPFRVTAFDDWSEVHVSSKTCALRVGTLYCWGAGAGPTPALVAATIADWSAIAAGSQYECGIRTGGALSCWGINVYGQLGLGSTLATLQPASLTAAGSWSRIEASMETSCGIRDGGLYCWGRNTHGQRGTGADDRARVGSDSDWTSVSLGGARGCGLRNGGELHCWGDAVVGTSNGWQTLRIGNDADWTSVSVGDLSACGIRNGGELYCWGINAVGVLGLGMAVDHSDLPARVGSDSDWSSVSVRWQHACGIRDNDLYCWGQNFYEQLGIGSTTTSQYTPTLVSAGNWDAVSTGAQNTCAVRSGAMYCWGSAAYGALGNGADTATNLGTPLQVGTDASWSGVFAGWDATCGIDAGDLYCWGYNGSGELGGAGSLTPRRVDDPTGWSPIDLTAFHSCGVRAGDLYCSGQNDYGELGVGDLTSRSTPTRMGTSGGWHDASVKYNSSCALHNGELWCWGDNADGILGHAAGLAPVLVVDVNERAP